MAEKEEIRGVEITLSTSQSAQLKCCDFQRADHEQMPTITPLKVEGVITAEGGST